MLMQCCFWIVAAPLLCMASGELHGQPRPAPDCRSPRSAARDDGVRAERWQTLAVLTRGRTAACPWSSHPGGCAQSLSSTDTDVRCTSLFALALHWANGSEEPSWKRSDVCLLSPSLTSLLWWRTKSQITQETYPNPIIECSYFHTRVWGNMHLFFQIAPQNWKAKWVYVQIESSCPHIVSCVLLLLKRYSCSLRGRRGFLAVNSNIWL